MCIAFVYLLLYTVCTYKHLLLVNNQSSQSVLITFFAGCPDPEEVDARYMLSFTEQFLPWLPLRAKKCISCGSTVAEVFEKQTINTMNKRMNTEVFFYIYRIRRFKLSVSENGILLLKGKWDVDRTYLLTDVVRFYQKKNWKRSDSVLWQNNYTNIKQKSKMPS